MKKVLFSLLVSGIAIGCAEKTSVAPQAAPAQLSSIERVPRTLQGIDGEIYTTVQNQPEFPGGVTTMYAYISQNLKYPEAAKKANVSGKVFVRFVVDKEGKVSNITTLKDMGFGCDEAAAKVLAEMPTWKPGSQDGTPVNVYFTMPISFKL